MTSTTVSADTLPRYDTDTAPAHLKRRSELARLGLRPLDPGQPHAYLSAEHALFDEHATAPIPPPPNRAQRRRDRDEAATLARRALADPYAVVLDCEATRLRNGRVIELSAVTADGNAIVDTLVNPGEPIDPDSTAVHTLTDADVAHAPTLASIAAELTTALADRWIIVWNAPFDHATLTRSYAAAGVAQPEWLQQDWSDAMLWHARHVGEWDPRHGCYRNHQAAGPHRGVGDCIAVWDHLREMAGHAPCRRTITTVRTHLQDQLDTGAYDALSGRDAVRAALADLQQWRTTT